MDREDMIEMAVEKLMDRGFDEQTARNRANGMNKKMLEKTVYGR